MSSPTAAGTYGPAVAEFFEGCLRLPEGERQGQPFVMEDWQREDTDIIYETDALGNLLWKIVVYGIPRGNGKSPLCAGFADHALVSLPGSPKVYCAAAAKDQAGLVHGFAIAQAKGGPLDDFLEYPRVTEALGPVRSPHNGGILRAVSADGDLQQGLAPAFVAMDELHTFRTGKQIGLYMAMHTTLHKRPAARMIIITTAGATKDSLLGELVDDITERGEMTVSRLGCKVVIRDYEARRLLIWYGAPEDADIRDPRIWRACNPASWISDESLRVAAASTPESEFRRYNLNQWVKGEEAAIQPAAWDACKGPEKIPAGSEVWVGVDIGEKRDTSAVAWGASAWREERRLLVVRAKVFTAQRISGMETTLPQVEAHLRWLRDNFDLMRVNFDPWQMRDMAARLASEGFPMVEFPQNNTNMVPASQGAFDLVAHQTVVHKGDPTLRAHILGTGGEVTATGGWRFTKAKTRTGHRDKTKQNDAAIAYAMVVGGYQIDMQAGGEPWAESW